MTRAPVAVLWSGHLQTITQVFIIVCVGSMSGQGLSQDTAIMSLSPYVAGG